MLKEEVQNYVVQSKESAETEEEKLFAAKLQEVVNNTTQSPKDYRNFDPLEVQEVVDFFTQNCVIQGVTVQEMNQILTQLSTFISTSIYNLNLLRALAGEPPLQVAESVESVS